LVGVVAAVRVRARVIVASTNIALYFEIIER
jgi:hypothetical protein